MSNEINKCAKCNIDPIFYEGNFTGDKETKFYKFECPRCQRSSGSFFNREESLKSWNNNKKNIRGENK